MKSLLDKTAIRIRVIPKTGISDFERGLFIEIDIKKRFEINSKKDYCPNGF